MKNTVVAASLMPVLAFALATAAQIAGLVSFSGLNPTAFIGGLIATGVLAFAFSDYSRKPAFRVRRTARQPTRTTPATSRTPVAASCDWTNNTRAA